jgi:uncharacterized iron-regulated membrane protein
LADAPLAPPAGTDHSPSRCFPTERIRTNSHEECVMNDYGGWMWLLIDVGFVAILGVAIVYGTMMWRRRRRRDPQIERVRDEATRRVFNEDEHTGQRSA